MLAEQELPAQVAELDPVRVRHSQVPVGPAAHAHQGEILEELAPQGPAPHHEVLQVLDLLRHRGPVHRDEIIVAAAGGRAVRGWELLGQALHGVEVEEPRNRGVLAGHLHHLLGQDTPEEGGHGLQLHLRHHRNLAHDVGINLDLKVQHLLHQQSLGFHHNALGIRGVVHLGHPPQGPLEAQHRGQPEVVLELHPEVQHVHPHHVDEGCPGVLQHLAKRL
mmetsp:Transcript_5168/g.12194  ORF Transcript_5168/g.12194 Transcript_5168/m.12194 type:complete len:220 (-) Transcript_5168:904-1563(-)